MAKREKDMSKLHNLKRFGQVVKDKFGHLDSADRAIMFWGQNDAMSVDQVFGLEHKCTNCKAKTTVYLDWQEVMHYGRAVNDWKYAYEEMKREAENRARG